MLRAAPLIARLLPPLLCLGTAAQQPSQFDSTGQIERDGRPAAYRIRRLPVSSFPELPAPLQAELMRRGCLIPQTYEAHRPENVIHGSLAGPGSDDWALLCSVDGQVSLLVAFSGDPAAVVALATYPEVRRLQPHGAEGELGFNWGIDPASPAQVRQAQAAMRPRPAAIDHDALADGVVDGRIVYRYYTRNTWTRLDTPE